MTFVSPLAQELAEQIHAGVEKRYEPALNTLDGNIQTAQQQINAYTTQLSDLGDYRAVIAGKIVELEDSLASIEPQRASHPRRLQAARRQADDARARKSTALSFQQHAERAVEQARNRLNMLREPVDDGRFAQEMQRWNDHMQNIDDRIKEVEKELKEAQQKTIDAEKAVQDYEGSDRYELNRLVDHHQRLRDRETDFERRIEDLQDSKLGYAKPVDDGRFQRAMDQYKADKAQLESELKRAESELSDATSQLSTAESAVYSADSDVDELLEEPAKLDTAERDLPVLISEKQDELQGVDDSISSAQSQLNQWQQALAAANKSRYTTQNQQVAEAEAHSNAFLQSSHGQVVSSWHRITDNWARNRQIWEQCVSKVAQAENQKWSQMVLPKYAKAYEALKNQKAANEQNLAQAQNALDTQNSQLEGILSAHMQEDNKNRWALYEVSTGHHKVFDRGWELRRVRSHLSQYGSDSTWADYKLVSVQKKPFSSFWVLLGITIGLLGLRFLGIHLFGLAGPLMLLFGFIALSMLIHRGITKSQGTDVTWVGQQLDWTAIAGSLCTAENAVESCNQRALDITEQSRQIIEQNRQAVAQRRAQTTVVDVGPHIHRLVPGFCIFSDDSKAQIEKFCSTVVQDYIAQGSSNAQLNLMMSAFPLAPAVPYSGSDQFVNTAIQKYDQAKVAN